jgi:hypothetical protein
MRIVLNLYNVGLGNNGGSRTIIRCSETLSKLGHEPVLYSNHPSKYTWHTPKVKITQDENEIFGDAIIATGYHSVSHTLQSKIHRKFYYIRGFETWQASETDLISSYKKLKCMVNSIWMYKYLRSNDVKSIVVYQGLDFDRFYNKNEKRENVIGALFSNRHITKRHQDAIEISRKTGYKLLMLNKDINNPNNKELNDWYNKIKIWISTSELEGLHNPPMESALSGCALICNDAIRSGTKDFAFNEKNCLVYPQRNLNIACQNVERLMKDEELCRKLNNNMVNTLKEKIGSREKNMAKLINYLQE